MLSYATFNHLEEWFILNPGCLMEGLKYGMSALVALIVVRCPTLVEEKVIVSLYGVGQSSPHELALLGLS